MLKVVCVVDKELTALDRLAQGVKKYHDNIDYVVLAVHPKRPDPEQLAMFEAHAMAADIIDWQYFRTAELLREKYDWLKDKKQILTHNNPYSIEEKDWNSYDIVVANNQYIYKRLGDITTAPLEYVPITVDTDFWRFNPEPLPEKQAVIMVANRIEGKKGILPVAVAAADAGLKFILVGAISDRDYFYSIMQTGEIEFHEQISDKTLRDLYYKSTIHVCNSVDNFESGTMPILEAMLCGVPVLTRRVGHVPEIYNGENMVIHEGDNEDVGALTEHLTNMAFDKKLLDDLRNNGWNSAKVRSFERRAYQYQKLYRQVLNDTAVPVTVIVPVYDKPEVIRKCLNAIANQTYKNIEVVVADDNPKGNKIVVEEFAKYVNFPVRYILTANVQDDYGLARARNEAVIEATGDILVFCDQRIIMEADAVEQFVGRMKPKHWLYGTKGGRKEFVENFSAVYRKDLVVAGMFNERISFYGGQSQEVRNRIRNQGMQTEFVASAKAVATGKSSNKNSKKSDIIRMKNRLFKLELD